MSLPPISALYSGSLPPINQIPGYSVPGQPLPNPGQQMNGFWLDPVTGKGISVENAGDAIYQAPQGNPLYYGQTASYTGPAGPTDGATPPRASLPPVQEVAAGFTPTFRDVLSWTYGDMVGVDPTNLSGGAQHRATYVNSALSNPQFSALKGLDLGAEYDSADPRWQGLLMDINQRVSSGGGDGGR